MNSKDLDSSGSRSAEVFSFHLIDLSFLATFRYLINPLHKRGIPGLKHSECFYVMNLGQSILSLKRFDPRSFSFFMWWTDEKMLDQFLERPEFKIFKKSGWHVRMKPYRKWGEVNEIKEAYIDSAVSSPEGTVVAVTLARHRLSQLKRFVKWGKPVEKQIRDHKGKSLALAAFRPFNTFCTFSVWHSEGEMVGMVNGQNEVYDKEDHKLAMVERARKPFHFEFTTMRFVPIKESGQWNGKLNYL